MPQYLIVPVRDNWLSDSPNHLAIDGNFFQHITLMPAPACLCLAAEAFEAFYCASSGPPRFWDWTKWLSLLSAVTSFRAMPSSMNNTAELDILDPLAINQEPRGKYVVL